ncbi:MAG: hypothetical protein WC943_03985 [Elusimicrobiota bacterium]|jgi:hypothetical protein
MKLTMALTLAALLSCPVSAGPAPSVTPTAPASVPKVVAQPPVAAIQAPENSASSLSALETGYNLFNLLAAPGIYDSVVTYTSENAPVQPAPQAQERIGKKKAGTSAKTGPTKPSQKTTPAPNGAAETPAANAAGATSGSR